jgi:uncharacterized protein
MRITQKPFKILSIDGGGVKGLFSAAVLSEIEKKLDHPISDYFDMICGTSTGGIIALALAQKTPAEQIVEFYKTDGPKIFPFKNPESILKMVKQGFIKGNYSNQPLKTALDSIFGTAEMKDSQNLLCIPSFNLTTGKPCIFKFPHKEGGFYRDKHLKMVDVALATSAAPTYLPIHKIGNEQFIDGGIWANNPALCGLTEALTYFIGTEKPIQTADGEAFFDSYQILSIATPSFNNGKVWMKKNPSFFGWKGDLLNAAMDGQSFFTNFFLSPVSESAKPKGLFHRIEYPDFSAAHQKMISIDKADATALQVLEATGRSVGCEYNSSKNHLIQPFFFNHKTYNF